MGEEGSGRSGRKGGGTLRERERGRDLEVRERKGKGRVEGGRKREG